MKHENCKHNNARPIVDGFRIRAICNVCGKEVKNTQI